MLLFAVLPVGSAAGHDSPPSTPPPPASSDLTKIAAEVDEALEAGPTDFWIELGPQADTHAANDVEDWAARGELVVERLQRTANEAQASIRAELNTHGVQYEPFWITNAILVRAGSADLAAALVASPAVTRLLPPVRYALPEPVSAEPRPEPARGPEWGVADIGAPEVWKELGVTGDGIVVASIDSGAQFDHPALVEQYRGSKRGGEFDHNYNWFDPSGTCLLAPCDQDGHGTHTMGTMIGGDGGVNQIGVAPGAEWIETSGCLTCEDADLLASAEWLLAPTNLRGENPRPDKRPHVINNSWSLVVPGTDPFMEDVQQAWEDAGMFAVWSAGNRGPSCESVAAPGSRLINYAAAAHDATGTVADFSSRGPGQDNDAKPDISAPGVDIRSSVPGDAYESSSGTSMAAPHVAGAVALLWSAVPSLVGDVAGTRDLLDRTAIDTVDLQCGGTAEENNVYGEGRVDAYALIDALPTEDLGFVAGTVVAAASGEPLNDARIILTGATVTRATETDAEGGFAVELPAGTYDVTVSSYGYVSAVDVLEVRAEETVTLDVGLEDAVLTVVVGEITDATTGNPLPEVMLTVPGTDHAAVTSDDGSYEMTEIPTGEYEMVVSPPGCWQGDTVTLEVGGGAGADVQLERATDTYGYQCWYEPTDYVSGETELEMPDDSQTVNQLELPFAFPLYGTGYSTAYVASSGHVNFQLPVNLVSASDLLGVMTPREQLPNAVVYPFWSWFEINEDSGVYTATIGEAPNRGVVIEWRNVGNRYDETARIDAEVILYENGEIVFAYRDLDETRPVEIGERAAVGIENADGTDGLLVAHRKQILSSDRQFRFAVSHDSAFVDGVVSDGNDGNPVGDAIVTVREPDGTIVREIETEPDGLYRAHLRLGDYTVSADKPHYDGASADVTLTVDQETTTVDLTMASAAVDVKPWSSTIVVDPDQAASTTVTIRSTGTEPLAWHLDGELDRTGSFGTEDQHGTSPPQSEQPYEPGQVITELDVPYEVAFHRGGYPALRGLGYDGDLWVSAYDGTEVQRLVYDRSGNRLADRGPTPDGQYILSMTYDSSSGSMCSVDSSDNMVCRDVETDEVVYELSGTWTDAAAYGLAYNPNDDTFFVSLGAGGEMSTVAGRSHDEPGEVLHTCVPEHYQRVFHDIAYNAEADVLWASTAEYSFGAAPGDDDQYWMLDPRTCETLQTIDDPDGIRNSVGAIAVDHTGNLWSLNSLWSDVQLIATGVPEAPGGVSWLEVEAGEGDGLLVPGESVELDVTVDAAGLVPGTYEAWVVLSTSAGRRPVLEIPITLVVDGHQPGVSRDGPTRRAE